jgi:hypothetical protein
MRNAYSRNWNLERKEKTSKMRQKHFMTWHMARNSEKLGK